MAQANKAQSGRRRNIMKGVCIGMGLGYWLCLPLHCYSSNAECVMCACVFMFGAGAIAL